MARSPIDAQDGNQDVWEGGGALVSLESRIPIISLYNNLILSLQGSPTDGAIRQLQQDLGERIQKDNPRGLVIDVSGMSMLDSYISRALRDLAKVSRLMGVHAVISGMHPFMALTLVEMGLKLDDVPHKMNLEQALEYLTEAFRKHDASSDVAAERGHDGENPDDAQTKDAPLAADANTRRP